MKNDCVNPFESVLITSNCMLVFTIMHAFIQSELQMHSGYTFIVSMCVPWELNPRPLRC